MKKSSRPLLPIRLCTFAICICGTLISGLVLFMGIADWPALLIFGFLTLVGIHDCLQTKHAILRNYPILGHMRFLLEFIRPEIRQYFIEGDNDKLPFSREQRTLVYSRSKAVADEIPFGTTLDVMAPGYQWINQ